MNPAVNRLRVALGDSATDPRYIETLPRRGYRYVAKVERRRALNRRPRFQLIGRRRHAQLV